MEEYKKITMASPSLQGRKLKGIFEYGKGQLKLRDYFPSEHKFVNIAPMDSEAELKLGYKEKLLEEDKKREKKEKKTTTIDEELYGLFE